MQPRNHADLSLDDFKRLITEVSGFLREYGVLKQSDLLPESQHLGTYARSYSNVVTSWNAFRQKIADALSQGPGAADMSYNHELNAAAALSAAVATRCDVFMLAATANIAVAASGKKRFPIGVGGRCIPESSKPFNRDTFYTPGVIDDDSMFRDVNGNNEFPDYIASLARIVRQNTTVPMIIVDLAMIGTGEDGKTVSIDGHDPSVVNISEGISADYLWFAGKVMKLCVSELSRNSIHEAMRLYYGSNAWEVIAARTCSVRSPRVRRVHQQSYTRVSMIAQHAIQMAVVMREYVIHGRGIKDIIDYRRKRMEGPIDRTERNHPKDFIEEAAGNHSRIRRKRKTHPALDKDWNPS